jgi:hypothetical protein
MEFDEYLRLKEERERLLVFKDWNQALALILFNGFN